MWVILGPKRHEVVNCVLSDWQAECASLACERVDDDGDEDVQEYLRNDDLEGHVIAKGNSWIAASKGIVNATTCCHPSVVVLILSALEQNASLAGRVKHDRVPRLTGGTSKQCQEGFSKVLEVRMLIHRVLPLIVAFNIVDASIDLDKSEL